MKYLSEMQPKPSDNVAESRKNIYVTVSYVILFIIGINAIGWGIYLSYLFLNEYLVTMSAYFGVGIPFLISGFLVKKRTTAGYYKGLILLFAGMILGFYFISPSAPSQIQFGTYLVQSPVTQISQEWHLVWLVYAWGMEALDVLAFYLLFISKDKFRLAPIGRSIFLLRIASLSLAVVTVTMTLYGIFYGWSAVTTWLLIVFIILLLWPWELLSRSSYKEQR